MRRNGGAWWRVSARFAESCGFFSVAGIDSSLSDNFGRSIMFGLSAFTTLVTISIVGGLPFFISAVLLGSLYYRGASPRCTRLAFFDGRAHRRLGLSCKGRLVDADGRTTGADCVFVRRNRCMDRRRGTCADWVRWLVHHARRWVCVWWLTEGLTTDSVTRSPLYSIYGETIAGVTILRAFGASSKFLRDMLRCVDTVRRLMR